MDISALDKLNAASSFAPTFESFKWDNFVLFPNTFAIAVTPSAPSGLSWISIELNLSDVDEITKKLSGCVRASKLKLIAPGEEVWQKGWEAFLGCFLKQEFFWKFLRVVSSASN